MDSDFQSQSPDNADRKPSFRKTSNDKANRKYRRRTPISGSESSSSGGSPKRGRSPSPAFSREDTTRITDYPLKRKNGGREFDMESGRSQFDKGGDSDRHSERRSYRSSHDSHRHDGYSRHHKHADGGERSYQRSSGSGRESRSGRSDRTRQGTEHDRLGDYWRNTDKYTREKSDDEYHRGKDKDRETMVMERQKHRDKDSTFERATSNRRYSNSNMNDGKSGDRDRHTKDRGGGRDDMRDYDKSLGDHKSDHTSSFEESRGHGRRSSIVRESDENRFKETQKSFSKELVERKGEMEKRKHDSRESDSHKERFYRGHHQDKITHAKEDDESPLKKLKSLNADKENDNGKDDSKSSIAAVERSPNAKKAQETIKKVISEPAESSANEVEAAHDFNAAKVAAMKAAELVNRNLIGGGYMSTDQKKKLLWGNKKNTVAEESGHRWDVPLFSDRERQEKFNKLMGVKGELKPEQKPDDKDGTGLLQAEKQEQLQLDLEKQYTAGLRRRDGRTVGLGL